MERKRVSFNIETATCGLCRTNQEKLVADDNSIPKAIVFCKTCEKFLCTACLKRHRRLVVTEGHQIVNRDHVILADDKTKHAANGTGHANGTLSIGILSSEAIKDYERYRENLIKSISKVQSAKENGVESGADEMDSADDKSETEDIDEIKYNFTEYCTKHSDQFIKYYCEQHSHLCCEMCKQTDHNICLSNVKFIPDRVKETENHSSPFKRIEAQIADFKDYDRKLQHDLKELKKSRESFLHDLKVKKRELLNWLNLMEVRAVRRLEIVFDKCKKEIERKRQKAKNACQELRADVYFLKEILNNQTHDNIYRFIKMKTAEKSVDEAMKKKEHRQFTNTRFCLKLNENIRNSVKDAEQLYEINFEKKGETKFNIRLKDDRHVCNITGCAMLSSGGVALADRNNANIKVFNSQFKLTAKLNVPDGVFDLTPIGQNALAMTTPLKGKIRIAEIKPEPEIVKVLETGSGTCWGIKHHEGVFIVNCSTEDASYIRSIDIEGNQLFQVETKCNFYSGCFVHDETKQLVISTATAYVEGNDTKMIQCTDEHVIDDGSLNKVKVLEYHHFDHLHTKGVTLDGHNNLVVCCKDTDQIYTIAHAGNEVELLLAEADGVYAPQALCYNDKKSKLLVSSENTDFIQIFEFTP